LRSTKDFVTKEKLLAFAVLEGRRLLVGQPRRLAVLDLVTKRKLDRVALAGRTVELVDHAAGEPVMPERSDALSSFRS
jgi:hypothetical protein